MGLAVKYLQENPFSGIKTGKHQTFLSPLHTPFISLSLSLPASFVCSHHSTVIT